MKRMSWLLAIALTIVNVGLFVVNRRPAGELFGRDGDLMQGIDLCLRRNEAACVLQGVNPYDVWSKKVVREPYYPNTEKPSPGFDEPINAYTPWEYVLAMPYACIPKQAAWNVHCGLMLVSLLSLIALLARRFGMWGAVAALLFVIPINVDLNTGNYGLIISLAVMGMLFSLEREKHALAGALLAVALMKPQLSLLFAVPLLMKRKWTTGIVAGGLCLGLSLVPAILCHTSPIGMIFQAPAASAHAFTGCALMPPFVLSILTPYISPVCCMGIAMVLGLLYVIVQTVRMRGCNSWLTLSTPVLLTSVAWTYIQPHGYILTMPIAAIFAADMLRHKSIGRFCLGIPAILLLARFARGAEILAGHFAPSMLAVASSFCQWSATFAFVLSAAYLWRYTESLVNMPEVIGRTRSTANS